jgi:hypothetical protein
MTIISKGVAMIDIPSFKDEILFWQDSTDVSEEFMIDHALVEFSDGSALEISARVRIPKTPDLTPTRISEDEALTDEGLGEACRLVDQTTAVRVMRRLLASRILAALPEREKIECPRCHGEIVIGHAICDLCQGRGEILKPE